MTGGRLTHLDLELGSRRDRIGPAIVFQRRDAQSGGLVDGFGGHLHRMPNAGSAYHIRFIFARHNQRPVVGAF